MTVVGNYAYIGVGPRLVILDVSQPGNPAVVGQTGVLPELVMGVAVVGNYAYVADEGGGLVILHRGKKALRPNCCSSRTCCASRCR